MAHSLPGLTNNLLSVPVLCDAGCEVFFHATRCKVTLNGKVILRGWHNPQHRLWQVRIVDNGWTTNFKVTDNESTPQSNAITHSLYDCDNTQQLTQFYHACLFSPVKSTLIKAINTCYLKGFPSLTLKRVSRHITINYATIKGHMDQTCQGQRSTSHSINRNPSPTISIDTHDNDDDILPVHIPERSTNLVFMAIHDITGAVFTDQTGRFPSHPTEATLTLSFSTFTMPTLLLLFPSRIAPRKSSYAPIRSSISICPAGASNHNYTKWTMKPPRMSRSSSTLNT
jgi:hypothetical protein